MVQPNDIEIRLGFDKIKSYTTKYCVTQGAKDKVAAITFSNNRKRISGDLSLVSEFKQVLMFESHYPQPKLVDLNLFLGRIKNEGSHIAANELVILRDGLSGVCKVVDFFGEKQKEKYPYLGLLVSKIDTFPDIVIDIDRIIDSFGAIKDNASSELYEIRSQKSIKEREAAKKVLSILKNAVNSGVVEQDATVSIRNGRAVIPVLSANKKKIRGFIHDESATGKTSFIEPEEIVSINNEIKELEYSEKREILKILTNFTDELRPSIPFIATNSQFIHTIDFISAKAKVAIDIDAYKPIIERDMIVNLINGRHPILEKALKKEGKPIIPLNVRLNRKKHIMVISGPNAGGKSVCLKTVGLLQYMVQCGFLVSASPNSEFGVFDSIFVDIGDQQSIENDLSTYSSHLENMKKMLKHSDSNSLILIDEFGSGTEPVVGGAIAEVILNQLEQKGVFGVITTHYTNLKYYASNSVGVINGAMAFDIQNILPLYRLEVGVPGSSFAFEIAHKIGLPHEVIQQAKLKIDTTQVSLEKQLREIARDKLYWERKREEIKKSEKKYDNSVEVYEQQYETLKTKRSEILDKARKEADEIVKNANKLVENTIREIKEAQAEKERTKVIRKELTEYKAEPHPEQDLNEIDKINRKIEKLRERDNSKFDKSVKKNKKETSAPQKLELKPIAVDDKVRIKGQSVAGVVTSISRNRATVAFGAISSTLSVDMLEYVSNNEYRKQSKDSEVNYYSGGIVTSSKYDVGDKRLNFKSEIDVRGKRVEEVFPIIEKMVDEAVMLGYKELKILHGKGTGALKDEIRKYLRIMPYVATANDEHLDFGGSGITVITLK